MVAWDIEAIGAYRAPQLAAASDETALAWAADRWDETRERLPTAFTAFDAERLAMKRAAHAIAGARELRSREVGLTRGPRDDPAEWADFIEDHPHGRYEDFLTYAAPPPPVADPRGALERYDDALGELRDRERSVSLHAEAIVETLGASNLAAVENLRERLVAAMPGAESAAAEGRLPIDVGTKVSLRLEHVQRLEAEKYIEQMGAAGALGWDADSADHRRAVKTARQHRATVERIEAALDQRRAQGHDVATWYASDELDAATRGLALHAVARELGREHQVRDTARPGPEAGKSQGTREAQSPRDLDSGFGL